MYDHKKLTYTLKKTKIKTTDLKEELEKRGIELSIPSIKKYRSGSVVPSCETLQAIADICNVSILDFFSNSEQQKQKIVKEELTKHPHRYEDLLPKNILPANVKEIPLINGYVGAGSYGINEEIEVISKIYIDLYTIAKPFREKKLKAIRVIGDSMKPYVNEGDIVIFYEFAPGEKPIGDGKYIISTSMGEQVKNLKFMLNGNIRIISENPSYHTKDGYDEEITKDSQNSFKILGRVVGRILRG